MNRLQNLSLKLKRGEKISVAYMGGSVTEGYGSSNQREKSWPALLGKMIAEKYGVEVENHNEGIGGTCSYFGAFRFDTDVAPYKPDLLFIEFAVNDYYHTESYETVARNSESILAKAYRLNPYMDVVYVLTFDLHEEKNDYVQLRGHRDIADKYGLLSVKMSEFMYPRAEKEGKSINNYYIDWVHPNDFGYQTHAEIISAQLFEEIEASAGAEVPVKHEFLGEPGALLTDAHFVYANDENICNVNGWEYEAGTFSYLGGKYGGRLKADISGSSFELKFYGTALGIFYGADVNRGRISISVDGVEVGKREGYRWTANPKEHPIIDSLPLGEHVAKFTLLEEKNEESKSNFFEIGVFLVA